MFSPPSLRRTLVAWLYAAATVHLLVSLGLTWAGHTGLLDDYAQHIEQSFWHDTAPPAARAQQIWWMALFGATLQNYALYMLALVHIGNRYRIASIWGWMMAGILLWAPQDMWLSLQAGIRSHLWIDGVALATLLPPLYWLYRHDRHMPATASPH